LKELVEISKKSPELKVMISGREETDIANWLSSRAILVRVGMNNSADIPLHREKEISSWLDMLDIDEKVYKEISILTRSVTDNADDSRIPGFLTKLWFRPRKGCFFKLGLLLII
jgi:hypothetical protein